MSIDRAALIEAAAGSLGGCGCTEADGAPCANCRLDASHTLDAILPLIADAIESNLPIGTDRLSLGISKGKRRAARLVRSLGGNDGSSE